MRWIAVGIELLALPALFVLIGFVFSWEIAVILAVGFVVALALAALVGVGLRRRGSAAGR
jgi:hypothetical protein